MWAVEARGPHPALELGRARAGSDLERGCRGHGAQHGPVAGAVEVLAPDPSNPDILYAGTVNGGVWKTTNATAASPTWVPLTDRLPSLAISDLAFSPADPYAPHLVRRDRKLQQRPGRRARRRYLQVDRWRRQLERAGERGPLAAGGFGMSCPLHSTAAWSCWRGPATLAGQRRSRRGLPQPRRRRHVGIHLRDRRPPPGPGLAS